MSSIISARPSKCRSVPTPLDFPEFLPYACNRLNASFLVNVKREIQDVYVSRADEKSKRLARTKSITAAQVVRGSNEDESASPVIAAYSSNGEVVIKAVFDISGHLVALTFEKCRTVPRLLLKIIGLILPFQQHLTKISIHLSPFQGICLYELSRSLPVSHITDINLEDTVVPEGNYSLLLEYAQLKSLSLARCKINDAICVEIASKLVHPLPASTGLMLLSLRGNVISDIGAQALGQALRSNRTLHHLNLAGNRITDIGASSIFNSLKEFNLTREELFTKRLRMIDYLKRRQKVYEKCLVDVKRTLLDKSSDDCSKSSKRKATTARPKSSGPSTIDYVEMRAEMMANEIVGAHVDPFNSEDTFHKDQFMYSIGNISLCYLNLSYNNLTYVSVVSLANLLKYQSTVHKPEKTGLMRVVIEGNEMPRICDEYALIENCLERIVSSKLSKHMKKIDIKKSRIK